MVNSLKYLENLRGSHILKYCFLSKTHIFLLKAILELDMIIINNKILFLNLT